nr:DUF4760 domain-containing protein [Vannielia litorea]
MFPGAAEVHWSVFLAPAIIGFSACVALWGIALARKTARERATLDLIEKTESTDHYQTAAALFRQYRTRGALLELADPGADKEADRAVVLNFLNHYELVSIGIVMGFLDRKVYREWMSGAFIRDWNAAREFIQRERWKFDPDKGEWDYNARVFRNFQKIAKRIGGRGALPLDRASWPAPAAPSGPGDLPLPEPEDE